MAKHGDVSKSSTSTILVDPGAFVAKWKQQIQVKDGIPLQQQRLIFASRACATDLFIDEGAACQPQPTGEQGHELVNDLKAWQAILREDGKAVAKLLQPVVLLEDDKLVPSFHNRMVEKLRHIGIPCNVFFLSFHKWMPASFLGHSQQNNKKETNLIIEIDKTFQPKTYRIDLFGRVNGENLSFPFTYWMSGEEVTSQVLMQEQIEQYRRGHQMRHALKSLPISGSRQKNSADDAEWRSIEENHYIRCGGDLELTAIVEKELRQLRCLVLTVITVPLHASKWINESASRASLDQSPMLPVRADVFGATGGAAKGRPNKRKKRIFKRSETHNAPLSVQDNQHTEDHSTNAIGEDAVFTPSEHRIQREVFSKKADRKGSSKFRGREHKLAQDANDQCQFQCCDNGIQGKDLDAEGPNNLCIIEPVTMDKTENHDADELGTGSVVGFVGQNDQDREGSSRNIDQGDSCSSDIKHINSHKEGKKVVSQKKGLGKVSRQRAGIGSRNVVEQGSIEIQSSKKGGESGWNHKQHHRDSQKSNKHTGDNADKLDHRLETGIIYCQHGDIPGNDARHSNTNKVMENLLTSHSAYRTSNKFGWGGTKGTRVHWQQVQKVNAKDVADFEKHERPVAQNGELKSCGIGSFTESHMELCTQKCSAHSTSCTEIQNCIKCEDMDIKNRRNDYFDKGNAQIWLPIGSRSIRPLSPVDSIDVATTPSASSKHEFVGRSTSNFSVEDRLTASAICRDDVFRTAENQCCVADMVVRTQNSPLCCEPTRDFCSPVEISSTASDEIQEQTSYTGQVYDVEHQDADEASIVAQSNMLILKVLNAIRTSCEQRIASEEITHKVGRPFAQFEKLLGAATPCFVSPLEDNLVDNFDVDCKCTETVVANNRETGSLLGKARGHGIANVYLNDIWKWYDEPSNYGVSVEIEDYTRSITDEKVQSFRAYFVPYLSAVQLFELGATIKSKGTNLQEVPSIFDILLPQPRALAEDFLRSNSGQDVSSRWELDKVDMKDCYILPTANLLYEFFDMEPPQFRCPLSQKIEALKMGNIGPNATSKGDPSILGNIRLGDLHPASWFCIAWYPIYRIPDGHLRATFLTYHSLSEVVPEKCLVGKCPVRSNSIFSLPVVGLQTYNSQGERWCSVDTTFQQQLRTHAESFSTELSRSQQALNQRLFALKEVASTLARGIPESGTVDLNGYRHPDYLFFSSRQS